MTVNDFTGKNIKDTYPRLVQTDGTNLADGTGSILPLTFEGNNVKISGSLIANEYVVSSSVTNISIATLSGSTAFGDSTDDTHVFTGHITASGNISASKQIKGETGLIMGQFVAGGNTFVGTHNSNNLFTIDRKSDAEPFARLDCGSDDFGVDVGFRVNTRNAGTPQASFEISGKGDVTASGNISVSGEITAISGSFEIIHGGTF